MASPFPGMDPYLEGAEWTSVHAELSAEIAKQLNVKLSSGYVARMVRRFIMEDVGGVSLVHHKTTIPDTGVYKVKEATAPYDLSQQHPIQIETIIAEEKIPVHSVEIRDTANQQLVTSIEILSPTNKRGDGFEQYVLKRSRILASSTHLLELDLLRKGRRIPTQTLLPTADYYIFLSRVEKQPMMDVWPVQLSMPLPIVPIPLLVGDADVMLDLQAAFTSAYEAYRYDLAVDYTTPPDVPLEAETAVWAKTLLSTY